MGHFGATLGVVRTNYFEKIHSGTNFFCQSAKKVAGPSEAICCGGVRLTEAFCHDDIHTHSRFQNIHLPVVVSSSPFVAIHTLLQSGPHQTNWTHTDSVASAWPPRKLSRRKRVISRSSFQNDGHETAFPTGNELLAGIFKTASERDGRSCCGVYDARATIPEKKCGHNQENVQLGSRYSVS